MYLRDAGFDILSVANNHTLDLGREGFEKTLAVLESHGIAYIGGHGATIPHRGWLLSGTGYDSGSSVTRVVCSGRHRGSRYPN